MITIEPAAFLLGTTVVFLGVVFAFTWEIIAERQQRLRRRRRHA